MGAAVIVLTALGPVLQAYHPLNGLNWTTLFTSLAGLLAGGGLLLAKDYDVHGGTVETGTRPPGDPPVPPAAIADMKKP